MAVAQIMVVLDQTVEQFLIRTPSHLTKLKRPEVEQFSGQKSFIKLYFLGFPAIHKRIAGKALFFRQPDVSGTMQFKHHPPADHIAQCTVGLDPVPCLAQFSGKCPSTIVGILDDQLIDKNDIFVGNDPAAIRKHGH